MLWCCDNIERTRNKKVLWFSLEKPVQTYFFRMFVDFEFSIKLKSSSAFFVWCCLCLPSLAHWILIQNQIKRINFQFYCVLCIRLNFNDDILKWDSEEKSKAKQKKTLQHLLLKPRWILSHLIELEFMDWIRWIARFNENYLYWLHHNHGNRIYVYVWVCVWLVFATIEYDLNAFN